jgi:uncharacterized protein (DUF1501 family)
MTTRRDFLKTTLAGSSLFAWNGLAPAFLHKTAAAARKGTKDNLLVVVQLTGGNDGLNTVVPYKNPLYAKYRPTLKLPTNELKKLNDEVGLHPAMGGFAELHQQSCLCVVQGVGYPNPDQSHFRSMDIWQAGSTAQHLPDGWLGRAMARKQGLQGFHVGMDNEGSPLAFDGAPAKVPSLARLEDFQIRTAASSGADRAQQRKVIEDGAKSKKGNDLLDFVRQTAGDTYASGKRLREIAGNYQPKVPYPFSGLANRLKLVAQLIDADLGGRVFYVSIDGFDTHAGQAETHRNLLQEVSDAMTAFFKDLSARGHKDRLLMMTFSEFGRRAKENGSKGTDHGSAAPMFLLGGKVKPGVVGAHPNLEKIPDGNLVHHTDFRQVYAAILDQWLGVSSKEVLGKEFKAVPVLA